MLLEFLTTKLLHKKTISEKRQKGQRYEGVVVKPLPLPMLNAIRLLPVC
jgi:hypothetical protein